MEASTQTGQWRALTLSDADRVGSIPMPPPSAAPEREAWIITHLQVAYRNGALALESFRRLEEKLGFSPDPAQGIEKGSGLLGQLSTLIEQGKRRELEVSAIERDVATRSATRRSILTGASLALGVLVAAVGVVKAVFEVFKR